MLKYVIFAALFVSFAQADTKHCKNVKVVENFEVEKFMGKWFELARFNNHFESGDCSTVEYTLSNSTSFDFVLKHKVLHTKEDVVIKGFVYLENPSKKDGILRAVFPNGLDSTIDIVDIDYDNYAVIWSCDNTKKEVKEFSWILSRKPTLTEEFDAKVKEVLKKYEIGEQKFYEADHTHEICQY